MATDLSVQQITDRLSSASLQREFLGDRSSNQSTLHILQWNILAQGLSNPEGNFVRVEKQTVAYETRKWRILEQILVRQPDLCALEEVDIYHCFLQDQLSQHGYTCFYTPKPESPCYRLANDTMNFKGPDGLLLCYKSHLFKEIKRFHRQQPGDDQGVRQFFAGLDLRHAASGASIVFVGTHQKAKAEFANLREQQTRGLVQYLAEHYPDRAHVIVTGDFNGGAREPFYDVIRDAGFSSAYRTMLHGREPAFTTWKFRAHNGIDNEQCGTIDYTFYKPQGFVPVAILQLPTKEAIGPNGLPSLAYPSDHLALETVFTIKP